MLKEIQSSGSAFGDMTLYGGLSAAFNGVKFKDAANCAGKNTATSSFVGIHDPVPRKIAKVEVRGAQTHGYCGSDRIMITLNLRASMTDPMGVSSAGQLLGSITIKNYTVLGNRVRSIYSNDVTTAWPYYWIEQVTSVPTTMVIGLTRYYEPYATENVTDGPTGAVSSLRGLRAQSDGGDNSKMWISADEAVLINPADGATKVLRSPMNYRCATLPSGLSAGKTLWAWLAWGPTSGLTTFFDLADPSQTPAMPGDATYVRHLFPVVLGPDAKIRSADHPVHVKDDTFYYTSGDYVEILVNAVAPLKDALVDLSGYVPEGVGRATVYFDPEIHTGSAYAYCGFIPKTGEGGNYAIVMVYGMAANGAFEAQMPMEMPMNDDRTITYQVIGIVGPITQFVIGYQLQSYKF